MAGFLIKDTLTWHYLCGLPTGETITEHGTTATRITNGDVRYSVNIMVDGQRIVTFSWTT
ncbi:MAG: hypothetical protein HOJ67_04230 [Rhodospirillaceae bacterium]|nr:hypothetical protein [Rhodospirillaceae bacterium]MBT6361382.1 hypothetical protein [Rhodospirillaceae bacterium]